MAPVIFLYVLCLVSKNYSGVSADLSTSSWQSLIGTGSFSWPLSLCSTMKSFGFISYPVINHIQQKKNFHTENVKPLPANIHSGSHSLTAKVTEDCAMTLAFCKLQSTICWRRNRTVIWLYDKCSWSCAVWESALGDSSWALGRGEGGRRGREPGAPAGPMAWHGMPTPGPQYPHLTSYCILAKI